MDSPVKDIKEFVTTVDNLMEMETESLKRDEALKKLESVIFLENYLHDLLLSLIDINNKDEDSDESLDAAIIRKLYSEKFINHLVSLPELIINLYGYRCPESFSESIYIQRLCIVLKNTFYETTFQKIIDDGYDIENFLSIMNNMIGRLCLKNYSNQIWNILILPLLTSSSLLSKKAFHNKLLVLRRVLFENESISSNSHHLEAILKMIFLNNINSYKLYSLIFDKNYFNQMKNDDNRKIFYEKFKFFIEQKLIWNKMMNEIKLLNLFTFLYQENYEFLQKIADQCSQQWTRKDFFKSRDYFDHLQLSKILILLTKILFPKDAFSQKEMEKENEKRIFLHKFHQQLSTGTENYLLCTYLPFRYIGLFTAELCLKILSSNVFKDITAPVFIEDEKFPEYDILLSLSEIDIKAFLDNSTNLEYSFSLIKIDDNLEKKSPESSKINNDDDDDDNETETKICQLDSDDDEDDLKPLNGSRDITENFRMVPRDYSKLQDLEAESLQKFLVYDNSKQTPIYLQDIIDGLISENEPEWLEKCLKSAEKIIRQNYQNPFRLKAIGVDLAKVLFHLNNEISLNNFEQIRCESLKALTVGCPAIVGEYLASQFWTKNLAICNRMNVLNILVGASQELSQIQQIEYNFQDQQKSIKDDDKEDEEKMRELFRREYFQLEDVSEDVSTVNNNDWKTILSDRIAKKTRYFAPEALRKQQEVVQMSPNAYVPVAGNFFFPLVLKKPEVELKLFEDDSYVLEQLLYSLGILLQNAFNHPKLWLMSRELLTFMKGFLGHTDRSIQIAMIQVFRIVLMSTPTSYLFSTIGSLMEEYSNWLMALELTSKDSECLSYARLAQSELLKLSTKSEIDTVKEAVHGDDNIMKRIAETKKSILKF